MAKILVVDDSAFQRKNIISKLTNADHEVFAAGDGLEGIAATEEHQPDLIVSDLLMPNMDGFQMIEELYKKGSKIPVIVLSADIQSSSHDRVMELGAFAKLDKPPTLEALLEAVDKALS